VPASDPLHVQAGRQQAGPDLEGIGEVRIEQEREPKADRALRERLQA
jgi:hypothetical protein